MIKNKIFMIDAASRYGDLYSIFSEKNLKKLILYSKFQSLIILMIL